ncbi:thiol:disulfide interchange protein [Actinobacillus equuli]|nr:thiol:disulfide interchange protein [Actinobacillus equuli]
MEGFADSASTNEFVKRYVEAVTFLIKNNVNTDRVNNFKCHSQDKIGGGIFI